MFIIVFQHQKQEITTELTKEELFNIIKQKMNLKENQFTLSFKDDEDDIISIQTEQDFQSIKAIKKVYEKRNLQIFVTKLYENQQIKVSQIQVAQKKNSLELKQLELNHVEIEKQQDHLKINKQISMEEKKKQKIQNNDEKSKNEEKIIEKKQENSNEKQKKTKESKQKVKKDKDSNNKQKIKQKKTLQKKSEKDQEKKSTQQKQIKQQKQRKKSKETKTIEKKSNQDIFKNQIQLDARIQAKIIQMIPLIKKEIFKSQNQKQNSQNTFIFNYECNHCKKIEIKNVLYKCIKCQNLYICNECQINYQHQHPLLKIKKQHKMPSYIFYLENEDINIEQKQNEIQTFKEWRLVVMEKIKQNMNEKVKILKEKEKEKLIKMRELNKKKNQNKKIPEKKINQDVKKGDQNKVKENIRTQKNDIQIQNKQVSPQKYQQISQKISILTHKPANTYYQIVQTKIKEGIRAEAIIEELVLGSVQL